MIPNEESPICIQSPGGSSTASSRDASPCRDLSPLINTLNAPIIVRRGPKGFGFTIRAIRVYFGDTDFYTVHHLGMISHKMSLITIFGHKHFMQKFHQKFDIFHEKISIAADFGSYLV